MHHRLQWFIHLRAQGLYVREISIKPTLLTGYGSLTSTIPVTPILVSLYTIEKWDKWKLLYLTFYADGLYKVKEIVTHLA